jgi:hypothetical protein
MPNRRTWLPIAKLILLLLGVIIIVLSALVVVRNLNDRSNRAIIDTQQKNLEQDRQAADQLVVRLDQLKIMREELVVPQVELNINF